MLGNPPWDAIQFKSKEFFAAFDFEILNAPTKREREGIERRLIADPLCGPLFVQYKEDFEQQKRANDVLYEYQKVYIDGDLAGRQGDAFRVFMERNAQLLGEEGMDRRRRSIRVSCERRSHRSPAALSREAEPAALLLVREQA